MSQQNGGAKAQNIQAELTKFIWKNENLREEFVKNPKAAMEKHLGVKIPDGVNVKCVDAADAKTLYFILPIHPKDALGVEFSDEQLDAIAGGELISAGVIEGVGLASDIIGGITGLASSALGALSSLVK